MAEKNKDLFLDMIENPYLTLEDLHDVGHSAESSRFLEKSAYENSQRVRDKFTDSDGNFKLDEFDRWYSMAANAYSILTDKDTNMSIMNVTAYDLSDITVTPEKRTLNTKPIISLAPNPDRLSTSIYQINRTSDRERTQSELALAEKVLLNPVEAAKDPSKAKWGDAPNDSWWSNLTSTQVLALWDEDGEHIDPVTGRKTSHKKGELKLNDNGTYYYEDLDGRSIYGRQVLNKFNTITTDGSFWNLYDFFDSDDIKEKSFVGSVAKNLALVGSMFIPYVGWGIAGASVITQTVGLAGTLGKMLTGSDNSTFSEWEGFAKSWNRQGAKSEYALLNMLCWENFIDMIGDTTALLREQRAIFKFAPAIFGKGKYGIQSSNLGANTDALKGKIMKGLLEETLDKIDFRTIIRNSMKPGNAPIDFKGALNGANNIISQLADESVKKYLKDYNSLGEKIARAYMVGITVGDTYGEAKEAGASDFEATMLTLGYAAAENKLLNSELGKWIFPELKAELATMKTVAKKATEGLANYTGEGIESTLKSSGVKGAKTALIKEHLASLSSDVRQASQNLGKLDKIAQNKWMKKLFNLGKNIYDNEYSVLKKTVGSVAVGALAEGTEEVSEELLKDFSTSCFNVVKALQGNNDVRMLGFLGTWDWNEALKRYGMSFAGGVLGGAINGASTDYRQFKDISNMNSEKAILQLVWMDRNGEMDTFWDTVSKIDLGDKYHSTRQNEDGTFKLGTANDNLDLEVKKALRKLLDLIHNILTAEGANIDDEGLIGLVMKANPKLKDLDVLGNFRANALATSVTAGRFLKEYNRLTAAIVMESNHLNSLMHLPQDTEEPSEDLQKAINESKGYLKTLLNAKDGLLNGDRTREFYRDALFETTYGLSETFIAPTEVQFMEQQTGRAYALINDEEKEALRRKYANWSKTERSELVHLLAEMFENVSTTTSNALQAQMDSFLKLKEGQLLKLKKITDFSDNKLNTILDILSLNDDEAQLEFGTDVFTKVQDLLATLHLDKGNNQTTPLGFLAVGNDFASEAKLTDYELSGVVADVADSDNRYVLALQQIQSDDTLTPMQKRSKVINSFYSIINDELKSIASEIASVGYIHPEVKRNLIPTLDKLSSYTLNLADTENIAIELLTQDGRTVIDRNQEFSDDDRDQLYKISEELADASASIKDLLYTPIQLSLKNFALGLGAGKNVLDLVESATKLESDYSHLAESIMIDDDTKKAYNEADKILKLYRAAIIAARVDNADYGNIYGFNKTLNDLALLGDPELVTIDGETADLAILDVNMAINRLEATKLLSDLNSGNKLNTQNYTAANKNIIMFNKTQKFITSILDDDDNEAALRVKARWSGLEDLRDSLGGLSLLLQLSTPTNEDRRLNLNSEEKLLMEIESHKLDDAIYDFFLKNKEKLDGSDESTLDLADLLNASKLNFYDKNELLLTQFSDDINDGSFFWLMAAKAAMKHSDAYGVYKDLIDDKIAPIPTQELGIFSALAAIYNGNVFSAFGKAARKQIFDDWSVKTPEQRLAVIDLAGLKDLLPTEDLYINEVNFSDLIPSYDNILFIEGIPGAGKSTGVFKTIAAALNKLNPEISEGKKLLDKPIYIAHSTEENAAELRDSLNFNGNTLVFGKLLLLSKMSAEYAQNGDKEDPDTGEYYYKLDEDVALQDNGELHSLWNIRKLNEDEVPSVIFIDEWSRYTLPEVDLINRFAKHYGVQVISAGDMDLLSPKATLLDKDGNNFLDVSISRNTTPFVPKLGVSMRTGNGQKSLNLHTLQTYQRTGYNGRLELRYVDMNGHLYGDKVYKVDFKELQDQEVLTLKSDIDKMIADLDENEKIGYIYSDVNSKLYKLLSSDAYKDKIEFKNETAAQGKEARFYIVENNRSDDLEKEAYFRSVYTGISRAALASLVIVPRAGIKGITIANPDTKETTLIPDNFTGEGIARFAKQRKEILNKIYNEDSSDALAKITPRTPDTTTVAPSTTNTGSTLSTALENGQPSNLNLNQNQNQPLPLQQQLQPQPALAAFEKGAILNNGANLIQILEVTEGTDANGLLEYTYKIDLDGTGTNTDTVTELKLMQEGYLVVAPSNQPEQPTSNPLLPKTPLFKKGDKFAPVTANYKYTVTDIKVLPDGTIKYELNAFGNSIWKTEAYLNDLKEKGRFVAREQTITPDGNALSEELVVAALGREVLEQILEEAVEESTEEPQEIILNSKDVKYTVFGHTWNTNYLGVEFDLNGRPKIPQGDEPGSKRIDLANGLIKIDPGKFNNELACRNTIGRLRKSIQFDSNEKIEQVLKAEIPALKDEELKLKWAFISKSKEHKKGDGGRFYYDPKYRLENMTDDEHADVPIKMLSLLVSDSAGNCILEIPMLTLGSPFTALHKLGLLDENNEIYKVYKDAMEKDIPDFLVLEEVKKAISKSTITKESDRSSRNYGKFLPGWQKLYNMCSLWQFSSDGVMLIDNIQGEAFNLAKHAKNTGPHYVKYRITENTLFGRSGKKGKYDYEGLWHNLQEEVKRSDVNYSSLMITTNDYYDRNTPLAPSGHPFVLRSDSDEFINDKLMLDRYIAQQKDSNLTKIVTLELVSPPEISVYDYLLERAKGINCHYGNTFSAYRILDLVRNQDPTLFKKLSEKTQNAINPILDAINAKMSEVTIEDGETKTEFASRVYRELREVMDDYGAISLLSDALFELTYGPTWLGNSNDFKENVGQRIQELASMNDGSGKPYMTGVLYRPQCVPGNEGVVGGPVLRLLTGEGDNKYCTLNGLSYRIYSKYDTPIFDLDNLNWYFGSWADKVKLAGKNNSMGLPENVYYFEGNETKRAYGYYVAEGKTKQEKKLSIGEQLKEDHRGLFGKLNIKADDIPDSVNSKQELLEKVVELYTATPGNIAMVVDTGQGLLVMATKLNLEGVTEEIPDKYKNIADMKLKSLTYNGDGDNSYTLTLTDSEENPIELQVTLIKDEGRIEITIPIDPKPASTSPTFTFSPTEVLNTILLAIEDVEDDDMKQKYMNAMQIIKDSADVGMTKAEIVAELLGKLTRPQLRMLKKVVGDEFFNTEETVAENNQLDNTLDEVCPITISKKLL